MADITMCDGKDCPLKETCLRFTSEPNKHRQSYFTHAPYKNGKCEFFHGEISGNILQQLEEILKPKSK